MQPPIRAVEIEQRINAGPPPQHTGRKLICQASIAGLETGKVAVTRDREGGSRAHRLEHCQGRAPGVISPF